MDGRYTVSSYNKQGLLTETKEYNKNGEMEGYTVNKYDDKGRMTESQHQNMLFVNSPNQILSQKNCMNMINTDTSPASSTNVSSATARRRPAA